MWNLLDTIGNTLIVRNKVTVNNIYEEIRKEESSLPMSELFD